MAQSVERVLGKDEVTSSNLVISSKKTDRQSRLSVFFVLITELYSILLICGGSPFWLNSLRSSHLLRKSCSFSKKTDRQSRLSVFFVLITELCGIVLTIVRS